MSEYIIEVEYDTLNGTYSYRKREKVVRCRDCIWFDSRFHYPLCRRDMSCDEIAVSVESDGYCAWGERLLTCHCGEEMETEGVCPSCGRMVME